MRILYVCDANHGGIAEYAIRQVEELTRSGVEISFLYRPGLDAGRVQECFELIPLPRLREGGSKLRKLLFRAKDARSVAKSVVKEATRLQHDAILLACFSEYLAPFWAGIYRKHGRKQSIATIAHDPIRDFVLGPGWWHRWSVRQGYSFVRHVFVHDETRIDYGGPKPDGVREHVIPHGPYELPKATDPRNTLRERLGYSEDDVVFLSFGQIRDGKNLDRFLRAMVHLPEKVKLLVAGNGVRNAQKAPVYYQNLAEDLGLAERCRWEVRFVPAEETGNLYEVCDHVLMTYSAKFRSASGVMNEAVHARKTMLVSAGPSPLKTATCEYSLGVFVEPDDDALVLKGAEELLSGQKSIPEWERFERDHSWKENVRRVVAALKANT